MIIRLRENTKKPAEMINIPVTRCLQYLPTAIKTELMDHLLHIHHHSFNMNPRP